MNGRKQYLAIIRGRWNNKAGAYWEKIIDNACLHYAEKGIAAIEKTPEPMRPLSRPDRKGQFTACFTKAAQPDYKGVLAGGRAVVFEAKTTTTGKMNRGVITPTQEKQLNLYDKLGAVTFVLLSFDLTEYFRVPWDVFRDMKVIYGRKYIMPADIREYQINLDGGFLKFL